MEIIAIPVKMNIILIESTYFILIQLLFQSCCGSIQNVCSQNQTWSHLPHCMKKHLQSTDTGVALMLKFNSTKCLLSEVVKIEKEENVTILGMPTEVRCGNAPNSGIWIREVTNLNIKNLTLLGCGVVYNKTTKKNIIYYFRSAANIENCTNVTLEALVISGSCGTGLIMLDNDGTVHINNSRFEKNSLNNGKLSIDTISGGSGLHIEFSKCDCRPFNKSYINYCANEIGKNVSNSNYYIINSYFEENNKLGCQKSNLREAKLITGFAGGGGMALLIGGHSKGNKFYIQGCIFSNNRASWGGGLYIVIQDESTSNKVVINASTFQMNNSTSSGGLGGGVNIGFMLSESLKEPNNSMKFNNCTFLNNQAKYGGGGHLFSSGSQVINNTIEMVNCSWSNNSASFGAALEITPNIWGGDSYAAMIVKMNDNRIISNYVSIQTSTSNVKAAMLVDKLKIKFSGDILFEKNNGSALCLDSSEAVFEANSHIQFKDNKGFQGGAIAMTGYAVIEFNDNSTFLFANNSAIDGGGALFQLDVSTRDIQLSRSCFIQYIGKKATLEDYNTSFIFINNSGTPGGRDSTQLSRFGHSILTTTIKTCLKSTINSKLLNQNEALSSIGNFSFVDQNKHDLSTFENSVSIDQKLIYVVPGKISDLGLTTTDDFSNEVAAVYHVSVKNTGTKSPVIIDSKFIYMSNGQIRLYGKPGQKATILLESTTIRKATIEIQVEIQECPPGYVFQYNNKKR